MGQPFANAGPHTQQQMAAAMAAGMGQMGGVRGPQPYPIPPAPPGAGVLFPGSPQQMAALRAMQQGQPGAQFAPYGMPGVGQGMQQGQLPAGGAPPRFQGPQPGFAGPQPPRQGSFQPPRM